MMLSYKLHYYFVPGRILNRFTKDIAVIDEQLPWTRFDFIEVNFIHVTRIIIIYTFI